MAKQYIVNNTENCLCIVSRGGANSIAAPTGKAAITSRGEVLFFGESGLTVTGGKGADGEVCTDVYTPEDEDIEKLRRQDGSYAVSASGVTSYMAEAALILQGGAGGDNGVYIREGETDDACEYWFGDAGTGACAGDRHK